MRAISFLTGEAVFAGVWLACRIAGWLNRGRIDPKREMFLLFMYVNLAVILRFAFFPMARVGGKVQPLLFDPAGVFPFRDYSRKRDLLLNVIGNVGLFIPSGILLPIVCKRLDGFWKVLAAGAGMSLCIEILQLPFRVRASDVDDLIMNTLGVAVGYGLYALVRKRRK